MLPYQHRVAGVDDERAPLTDAPDVPERPVSVLAAEANRHTDETRYALAGRGLGAVLSELHTRVVADTGENQQAARALTCPDRRPSRPTGRYRVTR